MNFLLFLLNLRNIAHTMFDIAWTEIPCFPLHLNQYDLGA